MAMVIAELCGITWVVGEGVAHNAENLSQIEAELSIPQRTKYVEYICVSIAGSW